MVGCDGLVVIWWIISFEGKGSGLEGTLGLSLCYRPLLWSLNINRRSDALLRSELSLKSSFMAMEVSTKQTLLKNHLFDEKSESYEEED